MSYSDAVAAKMARACDACLRRRARCFCEADDAFLCQACDVSVHSANPLSRRHHRIRLKTASSSPSSSPSPSFSPPANNASDDSISTPAWLHGFKRKPRTPRGKPGLAGTLPAAKVEPLVPDLEDLYPEENQPNDEEQLLYCVPILDPVLAEFCSPASIDDANASGDEVKPAVLLPAYEHVSAIAEVDGLAGFRPSDLDLAEFASDMETLLGRGLDDDSFCIDGLGLVDEAVGNDSKGQVKVEMEVDAACNFRMEIALSKETLDIDFDCRTPTMEVEVEKQKPLQKAAMASDNHGVEAAAKRRMTLRLDYEDVIAAWSSNGCSPWTDGERPQFDPNVTWPDFPAVAGGGGEVQAVYQQLGHVVHTVVVDEGREARVSRYREKRRTRLFSKKIRYEVRKLNAEKRPRMKGRFVKRSSAFPAAGTAAAVSALPRR